MRAKETLMMTIADYVAEQLADRGVDTAFELVGGMITHLLDALYRGNRVRVVSMHHEQGAAFAAEGWARMKRGVPGVALATSGPGATNLLTAIGSCYFDSIPAVFITGQVNVNEQKGESGVRQLGFQETDIVAMAAPVTKWAVGVQSPGEVGRVLDHAFRCALEGRPGPVLIDLPMNVQRAEWTGAGSCSTRIDDAAENAPSQDSPEQGREFLTCLNDALLLAKHPLVLAGGGVRSALAEKHALALLERLGVPVVTSLMGVDLLPAGHPLRVGMIGTYGNRWANWALEHADLVLALGSRFDVRQTGADLASFTRGKTFFQVDVDAAELNNRVLVQHALCMPLQEWFDLEAAAPLDAWNGGEQWLGDIRAMEAKWPDTDEAAGVGGIDPNVLVRQVSGASPQAGSFVSDVGQHQMWAAQSVRLRGGQRLLNSGGMGAMGFALPAAIGACVASGRPSVVFSGDGSVQLNIQELQTIRTHGLPVKIIVMNNGAYGMVRQFQEAYFGERYQSTVWGYEAPDFVRIAEAYGIPALRVEKREELTDALARLWEDPAAPFLLNVAIEQKRNAYPKTMFGQPLSRMEPAKP